MQWTLNDKNQKDLVENDYKMKNIQFSNEKWLKKIKNNISAKNPHLIIVFHNNLCNRIWFFNDWQIDCLRAKKSSTSWSNKKGSYMKCLIFDVAGIKKIIMGCDHKLRIPTF